LISSGGRLTPCKSTDAICAKLEEFRGNWKEAVEMMGAKVVGRTKKSARLEDNEDDDDDDKEKEEEEESDDDDQSTAAVVNEWCFDGSVPAKVFDKKPSKTDEKKKATAKGGTKSAFFSRRLKKFRWRKFLTARYWRRDQRLVKLLFVVYSFVAAILLYKRNAAKIKLFFWKRKVEKLRSNVANAAEMRMKSS